MTRKQQLQLSSLKKKGQPDTADDAALPKLKKKRSKRRVRKAGSRDAVDKSGCEAAATAKPKPSKPKAMASKPKAAAAKAKPAAKKAAKAKATRKPVKSASSSWVDPEENESEAPIRKRPSAKASKRPSALARKVSKRQVLKRAKALRASKSFETEAHGESGEEEEPEHDEDANPENAVEAEPAGEEGNVTFARRYMPTTPYYIAKWLALRCAYNERVKMFITGHSKMEDSGYAHACLPASLQDMCMTFSGCLLAVRLQEARAAWRIRRG